MAISQGWVKELSYFSHIAFSVRNGVVYNYNSRKLSKKIGCSHTTLNKHVKFLLSVGLLYMQGTNLIVSSKDRLRELVYAENGKRTGKGLLKFKIHKKFKDTERNICSRVVLKSVKQQKHALRITSEGHVTNKKILSNQYVTKKEIKRNKRFLENLKKNPEKDTTKNVFMLSDSSISQILHKKTKATAQSLMKFWVKEGLVSSTFIKGRVLDTHLDYYAYSHLREVRKGYESSYFFKPRNGTSYIIEYNKRALELGYNIKGSSLVISI